MPQATRALSFCLVCLTLFMLLSARQAYAQAGPHEHDHEHASDQVDTDQAPQGEVNERLYELDRQVLTLITRREEVQLALDKLKPELTLKRAELRRLSSEVDLKRRALSKAFMLRRRLKGARIAELLLSANGPLELKRRELSLRATLNAGVSQLNALTRAQRSLDEVARVLGEREHEASQLRASLSSQVEQLLSIRAEEARLLNPELITLDQDDHQSRLLPPTLGVWRDTFQSYRGRQLAKLYGHGVQIKGHHGAPVFSVEQGVVIYTGWLRNRGEVVILSHQGFMGLKQVTSVYAGVQPRVKVGDRVKRQGLLGELSGAREDGILAFELRHKRRPIYPRRYVDEVPLQEEAP